MATAAEVQERLVHVNGADIYCEVRGSGPPVLFISGALGDAGFYEKVGAELANAITVIAYDRRGNSRSPKPPGWTALLQGQPPQPVSGATSMEEQADDAAGLIEALGVGRVGVFGSSGGGAIGLELMLRHSDLVRGAVLHEPGLNGALGGDRAAAINAQFSSMLVPIWVSKGPAAAVEAFARWVGGDAAYEALDPELRSRLLRNGEVAFLIESPMYSAYQPAEAAIAGIACPVKVLLSDDTALPWMVPICDWLAKLCKTEMGHILGGHGAYLHRPVETAAALRPYLLEVTA